MGTCCPLASEPKLAVPVIHSQRHVRAKRMHCLGLMLPMLTLAWVPGIHIVPHLHVGVYLRNGHFLPYTRCPGLHFHAPFLTQAHDVFLGLDHDIAPPVHLDATDCRSIDGSVFGVRLDVLNKLDGEQVLETINRFGLQYDRITIYDQVAPAVKRVCSQLSAHDIAISRFHELDELLAQEIRLAQRNILNSSVRIVQVPARSALSVGCVTRARSRSWT